MVTREHSQKQGTLFITTPIAISPIHESFWGFKKIKSGAGLSDILEMPWVTHPSR
jgi:hypothetical protein